MAGHPGLVVGRARNGAAAGEAGHGVLLGVQADVAAGGGDRLQRRLGRQQHQETGRAEAAALLRAIRVEVDDRGGPARLAPRARHLGHHAGQRAAVVEVPVRQEDGLDRGEVDRQPARVVQPHLGRRADVEQHRVAAVAAAAGQQRREAVARDAQVLECLAALAAVRDGARRRPRHVPGQLRQLRHPLVHARQRVGLVVDHDQNPAFIERRAIHALFLAPARAESLAGLRRHGGLGYSSSIT